MKRLVLFGDSMFARFGKDLIAELELNLPGYEVYNFAAGGWDTQDAVRKAGYIANMQPEVVAISLGLNDAAPWKQVEIEQYKDNLNKIFNAFTGSRIILFPHPPVNESKQPNMTGRSNATVKLYHDAALPIGRAHDARFLDSWAIYMPLLSEGRDYHIEDGLHFNDFGNRVLIDQLTRLIESS